MNASPAIASLQTSRPFAAIATAGLIVGILDITSAFVIWTSRGVGPIRGLQGIAAGLLGKQSSEGGLTTASLGLAIHFLIAFVVVTIFYVASRKLTFLTQHAVISGLLYGVGVYLFMYWFVLPSAFATFKHSIFNDAMAVMIHMSLIGLPTALIVRRFSQRAGQ
ncbi:MAG: hypothetical protein QOE73_948 [Verrucomicrobiota bacterium]